MLTENHVMRKHPYSYQTLNQRCRTMAKIMMSMAFLVVLTACDQTVEPKFKEARAVEVTAYIVQSRQVPVSSELSGRVAAAVTADIRPQIGGIVRKLLFEEGSEVKAGQVLYEIDPTSAQTAVSDAQAALASAEVAQASAKAKAARYRELVAIEAVSQESSEEAEAAYKQAVLAVVSAQASLTAARTTLSYANVTSPIDGRIGRSSVNEGTLVTANQTNALAKVQQLDNVYLDATQSATEFLRIRQQFVQGEVKLESETPIVKLIKDDGSIYNQVGTLELDDAIVDQTTGSVTVRTLFPNPNDELIPGMYGKIRLEGAIMLDALVVPQAAVSRDIKGNALVYVIGENNVIEQRTLTTGQTLGDQWVVESGLQVGERIVVEGQQKVRIGSVVNVIQEADVVLPIQE